MKKKTIFFMITSLVLMLASCDDSGSGSGAVSETPKVYKVGDYGPSGEGIVFYVSDGGLHGLETAGYGWMNDPQRRWSSASADIRGTRDGIYDGYYNTYTVLTGSAYAPAELCRSYTGGDMNDWYLPSLGELAELHKYNSTHGLYFRSGRYWTSSANCTSSTSLNAYARDFSSASDVSYSMPQSYEYYVRPIRKF